MDPTKLTAVVGLLVALSVASERLVEIIKGVIPWLNKQNSNEIQEGWRGALLHALAVGAGVVTAFIARPAIAPDVIPADTTNTVAILALGLLASGGSGFWNSILTYLLKLKDLAKMDAARKKREWGL